MISNRLQIKLSTHEETVFKIGAIFRTKHTILTVTKSKLSAVLQITGTVNLQL